MTLIKYSLLCYLGSITLITFCMNL